MTETNFKNNPIKSGLIKTAMSVISLLSVFLVAVFLDKLGALVYYCALIVSCFLFVLSVSLPKVETALYKLIICLNIIIFVVLVCYLILDKLDLWVYVSDGETIRKMVEDAGVWGIIVLFLLTLLEVVVLPIPAAVTILIGTVLFGPTVSFIVSALGTIVGSIICFWLGRQFGYPLVNWIVGREKTEKYATLLAEKGKIPFIVMMLFPFFPDDILCMVAGLTSMKFSFFIITVLLTRPVMVAFYSYFGTGEIIPFSGWGIPVWIALIVFALFALYVIKRIIEKKK